MTVLQCDSVTVCWCDNCNTFVAQSFVSLVIKYVIGGLLVTHFNKVRRGEREEGGQKSDYIAFGGQLSCRPKVKQVGAPTVPSAVI
jgi:hypothetical protein